MNKRLLTALAAGILAAACAAGPDQPVPAPLLETYWRAIELDGQPVKPGAARREAHMILSAARNSVSGFAGCNTFRGIYERKDNELRFKGLATTLMACPSNEGELEKRFLTAVQASDTQRISGNVLELRDDKDRLRARFEARPAQ